MSVTLQRAGGESHDDDRAFYSVGVIETIFRLQFPISIRLYADAALMWLVAGAAGEDANVIDLFQAPDLLSSL